MNPTFLGESLVGNAIGTSEHRGDDGRLLSRARSASTALAGAGVVSDLMGCLVRKLDDALRRVQGVHEFCERSDCLLRIAVRRAASSVRLADGTDIPEGAELLELHLWNEHLPARPGHGLGRAVALRHQIAASLAVLASHIEAEPALAGIVAVRARTAFVSRRRRRKLLRVAGAFGFDIAPSRREGTVSTRIHDFWENFLVWGLTWTFNPEALKQNGLMRHHCELWLSRTALFARYGRTGAVAHRNQDGRPPMVPQSDDPFPALWSGSENSAPLPKGRRRRRATGPPRG